MIVDIHSHAQIHPDHYLDAFGNQSQKARNQAIDLNVTWEKYEKKATMVDKVVVFGGKWRLSGKWVPDDFIADYVKQRPGKAIGFLSVDPTDPNWEEDLRYGHQHLGLKGVKLGPMYAGFYPNDPKLDPLWQYCVDHSLPVLLHTGTSFVSQAPLDCTLPRHLDDVAIRFPEARIVMAHLGHPFEGECIAVIRKHPHVYADISALHYRPFQLYNSLMLVQEYGVWHKLLFGSDFPYTTVDESIEGLRNLNKMVEGTHLPRLSTEEIEALIHRDSLTLLGIQDDTANEAV